MSFSGDVKKELLNVMPSARHCRLAEISAYVRLLGRKEPSPDTPGGQVLLFRTESGPTLKKLFTLLKKTFNINLISDSAVQSGSQSKKERTLTISDADNVRDIWKATTNDTVLKLPCCRRSFLRGAFLAAGSVSTPEKSYHFEITCPDKRTASLVQDVMRSFELDAKIVIRKKEHVVYLKEGEQIVTALGEMGASYNYLNFENIRVLKEMRGNVNRRVNCETANLNKVVVSAVRQVEDIRYIQEHGGFGHLKKSLRDMAEVRLEHPNSPLGELGSYLNPPIGKSGVNHRLKRLSEIADTMRKEQIR